MSKAIDWIKDHKKAIVIGGVVIVTAACGGKYICQQSRAINTLKCKLTDVIRDKNTLMAAASEGLFEEAIATTTRKLNYRQDQLEYISKHLAAAPTDSSLVTKSQSLNSEIEILMERLRTFKNAQAVYLIPDIQE